MAYSDFTLKQLEKEYGLHSKVAQLFPLPIALVQPSELLRMDMERSNRLPMSSEKAKSELLITPIIKEIVAKNDYVFNLFLGISLDVQNNLSGICDYILSYGKDSLYVEAPIICLVEAKNRALEEGYAQCAAEMYAAHLFNQQENRVLPVIYGCVTNAFEWIFLKLEQSTIYISQERFSSYENLPKLLGAWQFIFDYYKKEISLFQ